MLLSTGLFALTQPNKIDDDVFFAGIPKDISVPGEIEILDNDGFVVGYSEKRGTPAWVAYRVFAIDKAKSIKRPSRFKADERVDNQIRHKDYSKSGYDRGHMAPHYAISTRYPQDMTDTYLMTNIIPQKPNLNRGLWLDLEMKVAKHYAQSKNEVWVICGPICDSAQPKRLKNKVSVPNACFKVVVDVTPNGTINLMGFIFPQEVPRNAKLKDYLVSVDEIEQRSGLDLMSMLKDRNENAIEGWKPSAIWQ